MNQTVQPHRLRTGHDPPQVLRVELPLDQTGLQRIDAHGILDGLALGMGVGITVSALTVKYRDLQVLVGFGTQLWMYLSAVVYSVSAIENATLKTLIMLNPVTPVIEFMRAGWLGVGTTSWLYLVISFAVTVLTAFFGVIIFNKTEKNFMDKI